MTDKALMCSAEEAQRNAYAPYSHFKVGAALLGASGTVYTGCNIENASYSATNCAERVALQKAVSEGERQFIAIALFADTADGQSVCTPCGICRQVFSEFCEEDFKIIVKEQGGGLHSFRLAELLPSAFTKGSM